MQRTSGILLHPTALPGSFRIGDFGKEAYRFIDFLASAAVPLPNICRAGDFASHPYGRFAFLTPISLLNYLSECL